MATCNRSPRLPTRTKHRRTVGTTISISLRCLAADGAKLALLRLYREGFRRVAFVHDELIVEIPIGADHADQAKAIDRILCEEMATLTGEIPIACEYALADRWYKQAEAVLDGEKLKLSGLLRGQTRDSGFMSNRSWIRFFRLLTSGLFVWLP